MILLAFCIGMIVAHYQLFPFTLLQKAKHHFQLEKLRQPFSTTVDYNNALQLFDGVKRQYELVFVGDSITHAGLWSELLAPYIVANRGIPGDTSEGILKRLDSVIDLKPQYVFLMLGVNDITRSYSAEEVYINYSKIVESLLQHKIQVVIQSTLLTNSEQYNSEVNRLNSLLETLSIDKNIVYLNLNAKLAPSGLLTNEISYDGIHLRSNAYLLWGEVIKTSMFSDQ